MAVTELLSLHEISVSTGIFSMDTLGLLKFSFIQRTFENFSSRSTILVLPSVFSTWAAAAFGAAVWIGRYNWKTGAVSSLISVKIMENRFSSLAASEGPPRHPWMEEKKDFTYGKIVPEGIFLFPLFLVSRGLEWQ